MAEPDVDPGFEQDDSDDVEALRIQTIERAYHEVWNEFYSWEQEYCTQTLASLAPQQLESDDFDYAFEPDLESMDVDAGDVLDAANQDTAHPFTLYEWDDTGLCTRRSVHARTTATRARLQTFTEHRQYESCTPTNGNMLINKSYEDVACPFIPYSDDAQFNARSHLSWFYSVSWQEEWRDPDSITIAAATIQRLTRWFREADNTPIEIYCDDIDRAGIFTIPVVEILHRAQHSDSLFWPGTAFSASESIYQYQPIWRAHRGLMPSTSFNAMCTTFCPKLNCIQAECFLDPFHTGWIVGHAAKTAYDNSEFRAAFPEGRSPCSPECFLLGAEPDSSHLHITDDNLELLDHMLAIEPDAKPCTISQLLLGVVTCSQVFARRAIKVQTFSSRERDIQAFPPEWNDQKDAYQVIIPQRCQHEGFCNSRNCECFRQGVHCQTNCLCSKHCKLRYQGCHCALADAGRHQCTKKSKKCQCMQSKWECTPELCSHTSDSKTRRPLLLSHDPIELCKNIASQSSIPPIIAIQTGSYGLGAFAKQYIKTGSYIDEYTCDLFWLEVTEGQELCRKFTKYNYAFQLNKKFTGDAAYAGNMTRFFNHSEDCNIDCTVKLVNGDYKILFFAVKNIKQGQELLFNYGDNYWL